LLAAEDGFDPRSARVKILVNKVTLRQFSLPVLQFPLSVSFHQRSILIKSSTTDTVQYFLLSTSVSAVSIIPPMLHTHLYLHVALTRTNGRCLGTLQKAMLFWKSRSSG